MVYTATVWVDDQSPAINATNLNKLESGVSSAHRDSDKKPYCVIDSTGGQAMNSNNAFTVNLDSETISNSNYSLADDIIEFGTTGTYWISFQATFDSTTNVSTTRGGWEAFIEYATSAVTFTRQNHLTSARYWREAADLNSAGTAGPLVVTESGSSIRMRARHTAAATAAFNLVPNFSFISLIKVA